MEQLKKKITEYLDFVYPGKKQEIFEALEKIERKYKIPDRESAYQISENDIFLIVYGDHLQGEEKTPLATLADFCNEYLHGIFSHVHLLPFFPYSSDDGFSVIDFREVHPDMGTWEDIEKFRFSLIFDAVINHASSKSLWFQEALERKSSYEYFIWQKSEEGIENVVRPRTSPLLSEYEMSDKTKEKVWTTFSRDQIDLNYENYKLFLEIIDILCLYLSKGATIFRLDAIAYLWKELGSTCIHHPKTHTIVKLMREILAYFKSSALVLTETNVPHKENVSYFGNNDEAHLIYQFSLPPLIVHTLQTANAEKLSKWASEIEVLKECSYFNFSASHDGIGLRPVSSILTEKEVGDMIDNVKKNGGLISYYTGKDGKATPYEMNITFFDAVVEKSLSDDLKIAKFVLSQTIPMVLPGIPAYYFPSLFGLSNYVDGFKKTGHNRTINREKYFLNFMKQLMTKDTISYSIFKYLISLLKIRKLEKAFSPFAHIEVLATPEYLFALKRFYEGEEVIVVMNVSSEKQKASLTFEVDMFDLITEKIYSTSSFELKPFQFIWLKEKK